MQLIHHHIPQGGWRILLPQLAVTRPDQQVIQHLVIGQQDIGRGPAQRLTIGNHAARRHHAAATRQARLPTYK